MNHIEKLGHIELAEQIRKRQAQIKLLQAELEPYLKERRNRFEALIEYVKKDRENIVVKMQIPKHEKITINNQKEKQQ